MKERRRIGAASRREAACRRLPLQTQSTRRNESLRGFLRKSYYSQATRLKMLTSVEGTYRNGRVELTEQPTDVCEGMRVIVIFIRSDEINLVRHGGNRATIQKP
ncbi:hypothetical protein [uncultured Nostoc sp.]|uniref:hypothetical protein n=1 Tax=uncultured Nostoc sp. TaxID=340711 RepID=UPI00262B8DC9|nr:hypothetical protein [uncultured Nostoc sp.]